MLVDTKFHVIPQEVKDRFVKEHGEYVDCTPVKFKTGMYWSTLNFEIYLAKDQKYNSYPEFTKRNTAWLEQLYKRLNSPDADKEYIQRLIEWEESKPLKVLINKRLNRKLYDRSYDSLGSYGVVDHPNQIHRYYDLHHDPRNLCVSFTPIYKKDQPSWGGWRWHKWGPYLGTKKPKCEYLYDEKNIDRVFVFSIIELK